MNDTLRRALADARLDATDVSASLDVDPKTVQRWMSGRIPQRRHRWGLADLLGLHEYELWPDADTGRSDAPWLRAVYPYRGAVPPAVWRGLFASATRDIGVLVYSGLFLAEDVAIQRTLAERAEAGVAVRLLLGDPDGRCVASRGDEEAIGHALAAKVRNAIVLHRRLLAVDGVEIRLHDTVLYNSVYRADDDMLVNPHLFGVAAAHAPVLHLRQSQPGDVVSTYLDSFDQVWSAGRPLDT